MTSGYTKSLYRYSWQRQFDKFLRKVPKRTVVRPLAGWITVLRECQEIPMAELGRRMGVTRSNVLRMEARERAGKITIAELSQVAKALDCDFTYLLRPRGGTIATRRLSGEAHPFSRCPTFSN